MPSCWFSCWRIAAGAVVHRDADAALVGAVGAAAVPQAAVPDQHAAAAHLGRRRSRTCWRRRSGDGRAGASRGRGASRRSRSVKSVSAHIGCRRSATCGFGEREQHGRRRGSAARVSPGSMRIDESDETEAARDRARPRRPAARSACTGIRSYSVAVHEQVVDAHGVRALERVAAPARRRARARAAARSAASASTSAGSIASSTIVKPSRSMRSRCARSAPAPGRAHVAAAAAFFSLSFWSSASGPPRAITSRN